MIYRIEGRYKMKTLIIYDNDGTIFTQITGGYSVPKGLQNMEIEIPHGKYIERVDTSKQKHQAIFKDYEKSETEVLKAELQEVKNALNDIILNGGTF